MPTPEFIIEIRDKIGHDPLPLSSVCCVVFDAKGRLLLELRADTREWALPGGIIDPEEQPADAAAREVHEETGVVIHVEHLAAVNVVRLHTHLNGDQTRTLELLFRCHAVSGEARVNDSESVDVGWFALDALPELSERMLGLLQQGTSRQPAASFSFAGRGGLGEPPQPLPSVAELWRGYVHPPRVSRGRSADPASGPARRARQRLRRGVGAVRGRGD